MVNVGALAATVVAVNNMYAEEERNRRRREVKDEDSDYDEGDDE